MRVDTDPIPNAEIGCHRTGFREKCRAMVVEHNCRLWTAINGADPNTGESVVGYGCADQLVPSLIIENTQMSRQTGAAVESFRNAVLVGGPRYEADQANRGVEDTSPASGRALPRGGAGGEG